MSLLEDIKEQGRIDHDDLDFQIQAQIDAATDYFKSIDVVVDPMPLAVNQAIILLVLHWFDEANGGFVDASLRQSPFGIRALVEPYRKASI